MVVFKRKNYTIPEGHYTGPKDIDEIPEIYLKGVEFHYVENVQDVWDFALTDEIVNNPVDLTIKEEKTDSDTKSPAIN